MNLRMAFLNAIKSGNEDKVRLMLQENPQLVHGNQEAEVSPLLYSVYYGQHEIMQILLEQDPKLNIWEATAVGDLNRVAEIVKHDRDAVNDYSPDGFTPLGLAAFFGQVDIFHLLLENGAEVNMHSGNQMKVYPIHSAAAHRNADVSLQMVSLLLSHGAEVNVAQHGGWTPLHQAASHGHLELVEMLLAQGADATLKSEDGKTAADMAKERGHEVILQVLGKRIAKK